MKLRYQLFAVSLLLLSLPWAGCQYIQTVDVALRDVQAQALMESAVSIADRLEREPQFFDGLEVNPASTLQTLYATSLDSAPIVDGYEDDWRHYSIEPQRLSSNADDFSVRMRVGVRNQSAYFFVEIEDPYLRYFNPSANDLLLADHLSLKINATTFPAQYFHIYTSAPGNVVAHYRDSNGQIRAFNSVKGSWRETAKGYQVELVVDKKLLEKGFNLEFIDSREQQINTLSLVDSISDAGVNIGKMVGLVTLSSNIQSMLESAQLPALSMRVLNKEQYIVARLIADRSQTPKRETPWIVEWLYRQVLRSEHLPTRHEVHNSRRWLFPEVEQARLDNGKTLSWYRTRSYGLSDRGLSGQVVASAVVPLYFPQGANKEIKGYLVVEKTTDQIVALTNSAFSQLFIYTLGIFLLVGLGMIAYASWLSWRISRLNRIAHNVVTDKGYISIKENAWPDIKAGDELGDLSRSYHKLLVRLRENQDYLRTLSNKLSHELRTPIAIVRSSLENIRDVDGSSSQEKYFQRASQGIERLSGMLNAMSTANRIEESLTHAEFEAVDLYQLLYSLVEAYNGVYSQHQIILRADENGRKVRIAEELFVQMIDKLVDNAVDFSPPSDPIFITLGSDSSTTIISVENQGPLLPDIANDRLFESMTSVREDKGSGDATHLGLGLYIVRLIAELHSIDVVAKNKENGGGVVFSLMLPN